MHRSNQQFHHYHHQDQHYHLYHLHRYPCSQPGHLEKHLHHPQHRHYRCQLSRIDREAARESNHPLPISRHP